MLEIARREPWILVANYGTAAAAIVLALFATTLGSPRTRFGLALITAALGGAIALGVLQQRSLEALEKQVIETVPSAFAGAGRRVFPAWRQIFANKGRR